MGRNLESLKSELERLPEGPDKRMALELLARTAREEVQAQKLLLQLRKQERRDRLAGSIVGLPVAAAAGYFLVSGVITGRLPGFLGNGSDGVYWENDPVVFSFLSAFLTLVIFAFSGVVLGVVNIGGKTMPPIASKGEYERRLKEEQEQLNKDKKMFVPIRLFGGFSRSIRIPWWFVVPVIGLFIVSFLYGVLSIP